YWEIRLIVAPYAFAQSMEAQLTSEPIPSRVLAGAEATDLTPALNEVQQIIFPASFSSTYYLFFNGRRTSVLGKQDGPDQMAELLNAMYDDGKTRFKVTNPATNNATIEFIGPLKGAPHNLIGVTVVSSEEVADDEEIIFRLPLDRSTMAAALRQDKSATTTFELEIRYVAPGVDPEEEDVQFSK